MRRYRRLVLTDRAIPFLAAFVGLVALAAAVLVQLNANARSAAVLDEIAAVRDEVRALADQVAASGSERPPAEDSGVIDAMLALQNRMDALEERMGALESEWAARPAEATAPAATAAESGFASADGSTDIDPDWPTDDCIPIGTRFMASVGDELAICQSPVVISVSAVTDDNVLVEDTGLVTETAFKTIPGSNCRLMVFSADAAGFAEMRVSCN